MGDVVVVVTDPLDGATVGYWSRVLADAAARRPDRLVVDLAACPRMDAAAIATLLRLHGQMLCAGGGLLLRTPPARVRRMLRLARVEQVLAVEEDPDQPGRALAGAR
jgi:anti-anti-sigma factor